MAAIEYLAMDYVPAMTKKNSRIITLKGPYSPLEMKMFSKIRTLSGSLVKIENDSVNSIVLDDQPGDNHERVLIAAHVKLSFFLYSFPF